MSKVVLEIELFQGPDIHVRFEHRVGATSGPLCGIHSGVSVGHQLVSAALVGVDHDAHRAGNLHLPVSNVERQAECFH